MKAWIEASLLFLGAFSFISFSIWCGIDAAEYDVRLDTRGLCSVYGLFIRAVLILSAIVGASSIFVVPIHDWLIGKL